MKKVRLAKPVVELSLEQYLEAKKRQLIAGVVLGIAVSAAASFIVLRFGGKAAPSLLMLFFGGFSLLVLGLIVARLVNKEGVNRLSSPPGSFLLSVSNFFCSKKTQEEVADQVIADMRIEYNQALFEKRKIKARWIRIRYCWIFFCAVGLYRVLKVIADIILKPSSR